MLEPGERNSIIEEIFHNESYLITLRPIDIDSFNEQGFLSLQNITSNDEINELINLYDEMFERQAGLATGDYFDFVGAGSLMGPASIPQILNPSRYQPRLRTTRFRANALAMARQILGPKANVVFEHAIMKPAGCTGFTPWHQDEAFYAKYNNYESITFWMPLQPVDENNGCLRYIPGSHSASLLPHRSIGNDPRIPGLEAVFTDPGVAVACPLPAGGVTIHHRRTLHSSTANNSNQPRRAYALGFGVRSRAATQRFEHPWNLEKQAARSASGDVGPLDRCLVRAKQLAKAVLR